MGKCYEQIIPRIHKFEQNVQEQNSSYSWHMARKEKKTVARVKNAAKTMVVIQLCQQWQLTRLNASHLSEHVNVPAAEVEA